MLDDPTFLNSDLGAVQRWVSSNKMFINKKKTKSLLAHGKRIPAKLDDVTPLRLDVNIKELCAWPETNFVFSLHEMQYPVIV